MKLERKGIYKCEKNEHILILASNDRRTTFVRLKKNVIAPSIFMVRDFGFACIDSIYTVKNNNLWYVDRNLLSRITDAEFAVITAGVHSYFNGFIESEMGGFYYSDDADAIKEAIMNANSIDKSEPKPTNSLTREDMLAKFEIEDAVRDFITKYLVADENCGVFAIDAFEKFKKHYTMDMATVKFVNVFRRLAEKEYGAVKEYRAKKIHKIVYLKGIRFRAIPLEFADQSIKDDSKEVDLNKVNTEIEYDRPLDEPTLESIETTVEEATEEVEYVNDFDKKGSNQKYYDLLQTEQKGTKNSCAQRRTKKDPKGRSIRHMYSEDEVISIASAENARVVMSMFGIGSYSTASLIMVNAKKILGVYTAKPNSNDYYELWNNGVTLEEADAIYPDVSKNVLACSYEAFCNKDSIDNESAKIKWANPLEVGNRYILAKLLEASSVKEFAKTEKCSIKIATKIIANIRDILAFNPLWLAFGSLAYADSYEITNHINSCRNLDTTNAKIDVMLFDTIMSLFVAYRKSYNDHAAILAGSIPIPDAVPEDKKEFFIKLITKRFYIGERYKFKNEDYNLFFPERQDMEIAKKFIIRGNKITGCLWSFKLYLKKGAK